VLFDVMVRVDVDPHHPPGEEANENGSDTTGRQKCIKTVCIGPNDMYSQSSPFHLFFSCIIRGGSVTISLAAGRASFRESTAVPHARRSMAD
jgi:hypothetical protein